MAAHRLAHLAVIFCAAIAQAGTVSLFDTTIDARLGPQYTGDGKNASVLFYKPTAAGQSLHIENVVVHDATDQKALDIVANQYQTGQYYVWENITVKNYEAYNIWRSGTYPSLHTDFLRIAGAGNYDGVKTNVLLQNIFVHDGDALPEITQDGVFGTIEIDNFRLEDTTRQKIQITTERSGSIDKIVIRNSPGLGLDLTWRADTIQAVEIWDSPNFTLVTHGPGGADAPTINYYTTPPTVDTIAVPLPSAVWPGLVALGLIIGWRIRRSRRLS